MISFRRLGRLGRIGNQMFQIASTIGIANKHSRDYAFPKWNYGSYFKHPFWDDTSFIPTNAVNTTENELFSISKHKFVNLEGYFQNEKYFIQNKLEIKNLFSLKDEFEDYIDNKYPDLKDYCAIHVRRGDYLEHPTHHPNLGMEYYNKAIESSGYEKFLVCSDDIEWCKQNFPTEYKFVENETDIIDLFIMSKCGANIISNSSFSWWSAWLNNSPLTICPSIWFGPDSDGSDDIICNNWRKI